MKCVHGSINIHNYVLDYVLRKSVSSTAEEISHVHRRKIAL
jgi:hypothetical protein